MTTTADNSNLHLQDYGQSIWMDHLSRDILQLGELQKLSEFVKPFDQLIDSLVMKVKHLSPTWILK